MLLSTAVRRQQGALAPPAQEIIGDIENFEEKKRRLGGRVGPMRDIGPQHKDMQRKQAEP